MPNWVNNQVAIIGKKNSINAFIKLGLKNSGLKCTDDVMTNFRKLVKSGKHLSVSAKPEEDRFKSCYIDKVCLERGVTMRTFLPMPFSYLACDTTNSPNAYDKKVVMAQYEQGAVGWYDYNLKTLGTKWDSGLDGLNITQFGEDCFEISFTIDTAWSVPDIWFLSLKKKFPNLHIIFSATEESNAFIVVCNVKDENNIEDYEDFTFRVDEYNAKYDEVKERLSKKYSDDELYDKVIEEIGDFPYDNIYDELYDSFTDLSSDIQEQVMNEKDCDKFEVDNDVVLNDVEVKPQNEQSKLEKLKLIVEKVSKMPKHEIEVSGKIELFGFGLYDKPIIKVKRVVSANNCLSFYGENTYNPIVSVNCDDGKQLHECYVNELYDEVMQ